MFNTLVIGNIAIIVSAQLAKQIVKNIWDLFTLEGIYKTILGYKFKIDMDTFASVYCRLPSYGPNESKIIMKHAEVLLSNKWIRECRDGGYGAPIVLAPIPHQNEIENIENFVWQLCVS